MIDRSQFEQLRSEVKSIQSTMHDIKRQYIICSWLDDSGKFHVEHDWPNWTNGSKGYKTAVTSCQYSSPVDNVVTRILSGMGL